MSVPTPLLDLLRRGDAARDVRLLAAQGALAPRAPEQLSMLVLLLEDADPEVRSAAAATLRGIPQTALSTLLSRTDVPSEVRTFLADRGIVPSGMAAEASDEPLVDTAPSLADEPQAVASAESVGQRVAKMTFAQRLQAAVKGSREMRAVLIRDPSKAIALAVLSSPRVTERDVESYARMSTVAEDVLRAIAGSRLWIRNYGIVSALTKNPKTPLTLSLKLLPRLNDRDLVQLSIDRNVPEPLRFAARRKVVAEGR